ncbi:hypothetical protein JOC27_001667 [Sporolactobacillus spathodeae]|uniref:Uncharacterized protein n=1 Tax=Sporolactobacillus spathodeae TaxID=1465502 RepID=A0ABS2Q8V4_9BACL|nr:hypothetical protein [Sporolactobacillus spathodeae]
MHEKRSEGAAPAASEQLEHIRCKQDLNIDRVVTNSAEA